MNKSESIASLSKALVIASSEFKPVLMNSTNPFYKSKYADLGAVIETAKPILKNHGLAVSQLVEGENGQVGVTTLLIHESGEWLSSFVTIPVTGQNVAQEAGKAVTYLRRYALAAILGLYADEDTDGEGSHKEQPKQEKKTATEQFQSETGAVELVGYLSDKVVSMVADKKGLSKQDAVAALNELLKAGKIEKKMTIQQFVDAIA